MKSSIAMACFLVLGQLSFARHANRTPLTNPLTGEEWVLEKDYAGIKIYDILGGAQGQKKNISYANIVKSLVFEDDAIFIKFQGKSFSWPEAIFDKPLSPRWPNVIRYGKEYEFYPNSRKKKEKCYSIIEREVSYREFVKSVIGPVSQPCGEEIEYHPDGSVKIRSQYPEKCLQGCGEFKPFMPPGKYKVRASSLVFRDKPSTKGKSLGTIAKDAELQVIEDTHKIETHDFETAPWVKIKYDGKTGYVFGGFLDSLERNDL